MHQLWGLCAALSGLVLASEVPPTRDPWLPYPVPFATAPDSAAVHAITEYGAVGDNATMNTAAIARAFDGCEQGGGGYVAVPAGAFTAPVAHHILQTW